ncbi:MAG: hypothetical protein O7G31_08490 [Calditrichaeota bacterium]|nr:hypothetical protein [Calditrichota bacterium]
MGVQEIIVFAIVLIAGVFTAKKFVRQFTPGDGGKTCAKCELQKAVTKKNL